MKIKLRPDQPGESGPTEWSEMNDWLADLKAMADEEQGTSFGPANDAEPRDGAEARDEVQPLSAAVPEDDGVVAPPATTSWTDNDPAPALGSHQTYGIGETYGAPVPAADNDADAPTPGAPAAYGPASSFTPAPTTFPAPEVPPQAHGSGAYPVVGGYGAYPTAGGSGAYPVTSPFGAPEAGLASGVGAAGVASETDPETATDLGTAARAGEANAYGADAAGVADVAGGVAEPEPYGAPSEVAADLLDDPGADAPIVTGGTGIAGATGGVDVTGGVNVAGGNASAISPAQYAPPMPSVTPAPPAAPPPSRPAAVKPAPAVESTPVGALIGDELRTPMVWCELDPGHCVSWHADRAALGVADVRARAIAAGWRIDALGRLTCPQCQQRSTTFRATQQVVLWDRAYALTMAAREAARQGGFPYPQPAFYPR